MCPDMVRIVVCMAVVMWREQRGLGARCMLSAKNTSAGGRGMFGIGRVTIIYL